MYVFWLGKLIKPNIVIGPNTYRRSQRLVVSTLLLSRFELLPSCWLWTFQYHQDDLSPERALRSELNRWLPKPLMAVSAWIQRKLWLEVRLVPGTAHIMGMTSVKVVFFDHVEPHGPVSNPLRRSRAISQQHIINHMNHQVCDQDIASRASCAASFPAKRCL